MSTASARSQSRLGPSRGGGAPHHSLRGQQIAASPFRSFTKVFARPQPKQILCGLLGFFTSGALHTGVRATAAGTGPGHHIGHGIGPVFRHCEGAATPGLAASQSAPIKAP
ncbi:hypothetical protein NDU88_007174 [Pleurodeles waltl]|uniref:Uncharacterized protein n=1 Tax=Pleurodeles waltl TaxID=8319 RepID=A0AAV7RPB6_PLEWA|nr:hypothetical protein NDU88_007174 [Pleurodeles waltl]